MSLLSVVRCRGGRQGPRFSHRYFKTSHREHDLARRVRGKSLVFTTSCCRGSAWSGIYVASSTSGRTARSHEDARGGKAARGHWRSPTSRTPRRRRGRRKTWRWPSKPACWSPLQKANTASTASFGPSRSQSPTSSPLIRKGRTLWTWLPSLLDFRRLHVAPRNGPPCRSTLSSRLSGVRHVDHPSNWTVPLPRRIPGHAVGGRPWEQGTPSILACLGHTNQSPA